MYLEGALSKLDVQVPPTLAPKLFALNFFQSHLASIKLVRRRYRWVPGGCTWRVRRLS